MKLFINFKKHQAAVALCIFVLGILVLIFFPKEVRNGGTNGGFLCIQVLIPSLFPFMVLTDFFTLSGLGGKAPKFVGVLTRYLFKLPKEAGAVILLSLLGGYPVGAKGIKSLHTQGLISDKQAEQMAMFCVASGPGFLVTYLGVVIIGNIKIGYFLLISQVITVLTLGIISVLFTKTDKTDTMTAVRQEAKTTDMGDAFVMSVVSGIKSLAGLCGLVILFGGICEVFICITKGNPVLTPLVSLLEITMGTKIMSSHYPPYLVSFFCGFGGLCVHLQIFMQLKGIEFSKSLFFLFRILQGVLSALITLMLTTLFPSAVEVFSNSSSSEPKFYSSVAGCFLLILCSGIFLIIIQNMGCKNRHFRR